MNETHIDVCSSLVDKINNICSDGLHFSRPASNLRANEADLVQGVLKMLQGFSSPLFYWDQSKKAFCTKSGIYVSHLSRESLHAVLNQFKYAATCLQLVDLVVDKVKLSLAVAPPTLRAFAYSISSWMKRLRDIALKEEMKMSSSNNETTPTLLGLANSLSSLCSGAEHLLEIVHRSIPPEYFHPNPSITAAEVAVHILDYLYQRLDEACLVQGGEEEAYRMLLYLFVGSILPYIESLDSWLYEGTLDDPFEELFFYANEEISLEDADFWEKSYLFRLVQQHNVDSQQTILTAARDLASLIGDKKEPNERVSNSIRSSLRGKEWTDKNHQLCPLFIKDIAKSIVSAGKSLQLIQHVPSTPSTKSCIGNNNEVDAFHGQFKKTSFRHSAGGLSLSEIFCVSLAGLLGHGDHLSRWYKIDNSHGLEIQENKSVLKNGDSKFLHAQSCTGKIWWKLLVDTFSEKREDFLEPADANNSLYVTKGSMDSKTLDSMTLLKSFCPENPAVTVCNTSLMLNVDAWRSLNISKNLNLPPLNDEVLWNAIFCEDVGLVSTPHGTDCTFGFQFSELENLQQQVDRKLLEGLFPFPTLLPPFEEEIQVQQLLPFQKNSTFPSKVLRWIQDVEPKTTPFPLAIMQECLVVYIERQVDKVGKKILSKLMHDWRLMDELAVLRAIYLLGSGDLLQHFLTVLFNKLDREEAWDDDFELNAMLQESIRNSADGSLLNSPDSLVVSVVRSIDYNVDEQNTMPPSTHKNVGQSYGIDALDSLKFTYKVSWPLELVANVETIKKYNQVMGFLLKVKRAKFVLDKTRRWMWKGKGNATYSHKYHWLVEQKLLHFVDAFHQYVMDRVYHNSWRELCEGMASAASLDEVMEVHEAYLMSIQRQCFVVPDKLWALISYRVNIILGLALDFYSVQKTLSSGGAVPAVKARCDMKVEQIEKQFDDCIAFLLRVLSFKLNVGNFPHLAVLVTRINYNHFYMSDNGSLKPTTSAENGSSRLAKPFPGRTN